MTFLHRRSIAGLVAAIGVATFGCAAARFTADKRPDGTRHLRCKTSLPDCLLEAERLCQGRHYVVLRAVDEHDHRGGPELNLDVRTSEAIVRCGPALAWPAGVDPMALEPETCAAPSPPTPPAAPPPPPKACVPGVTQPCTGPGGCGGGQACLPDGTGFGACDCGTDGVGLGRTR
jgi:hypothetical protein